MTPEQIEKVREHLNRAKTILTCQFRPDPGDAADEVEAALAALNGEQEEVWEAYEQDNGLWRVASADGEYIAHDASHRQAARIARLPALERAARDAARFLERSGGADPASEHETVREALYTALTDKTEA